MAELINNLDLHQLINIITLSTRSSVREGEECEECEECWVFYCTSLILKCFLTFNVSCLDCCEIIRRISTSFASSRRSSSTNREVFLIAVYKFYSARGCRERGRLLFRIEEFHLLLFVIPVMRDWSWSSRPDVPINSIQIYCAGNTKRLVWIL